MIIINFCLKYLLLAQLANAERELVLKRLWLLSILFIAALVLVIVISKQFIQTKLNPIKIAALHSITGPMAISEKPLVDAITLAVEEINATGGLLGRPVQLLIVDGKSNPNYFAKEAERLIIEGQVSALFACWTSACRKALQPVVENHNHLMFYPVQYEGMEQSENIFYLGATPNQQIIPGTRWAFKQFGKRVYLIGSDYIFPRIANLIIRDLIQISDGQVLAERYMPLEGKDYTAIVNEIRQLKPDIVLNTINGQSNQYFFRTLKQTGLAKQPILSFSVAEPELQAMPVIGEMEEHYAVWGYFQSIPTETNEQFIQSYRQRFGQERVTSDPIVTAYMAVKLWANTVKEAGTDDFVHINRFLLNQSVSSPLGISSIDKKKRHLWRSLYIGKSRVDGQFDIIYRLPLLIQPFPFPGYRSQHEWRQLMQQNNKFQKAVP